MKCKLDLKSLALGALAGVVVLLSVGAATSTTVGDNKGWEYRTVAGKVFQNELENGINARVAEGWELVTVCSMNVEHHAFALMRRQKK